MEQTAGKPIPPRDPNHVMQLHRLGSFHQSRLSFMRILLRRLEGEAWTLKTWLRSSLGNHNRRINLRNILQLGFLALLARLLRGRFWLFNLRTSTCLCARVF